MFDQFDEQLGVKPERTGLSFRSAGDICQQPQPVDWLIKGYLDANSLGVLFGAAGCGKSFLALDAGLSIAAGLDWQGLGMCKQGPVFYICGEGFAGVGRRLKAWELEHKKNLKDMPFFISTRAAGFLDGDANAIQQAIDELRAEHGAPFLIIIDTLNRNFGAGDENSTGDMTKFVSEIDRLRLPYRCAVLIVHHSGLTMVDRARGASALRAALDWEYRVLMNADGTRTLDCTKAKDHEPPEPFFFELASVDLDWTDEEGEPLTSCVIRRTEEPTRTAKPLRGARKIAFDALVGLSTGDDGVHIDEWRLACYDKAITPSSSQEAKKKAFQRAVSELRNSGLVCARNDLWWVNQTGHSGTTL